MKNGDLNYRACRMAPLRHQTLMPMDDPAERTTLDERLKRAEKLVAKDSAAGRLARQDRNPMRHQKTCATLLANGHNP